jgi:large subunit ribosomal protein L19
VAAIGDVNRAKLYYLRGRVGKKARVREQRYSGVKPEVLAEEPMVEEELPVAEEPDVEEAPVAVEDTVATPE